MLINSYAIYERLKSDFSISVFRQCENQPAGNFWIESIFAEEIYYQIAQIRIGMIVEIHAQFSVIGSFKRQIINMIGLG